MATARYLSCRTTIPIPAVLAFQHLSNEDSTPCFAVFEKVEVLSLSIGTAL